MPLFSCAVADQCQLEAGFRHRQVPAHIHCPRQRRSRRSLQIWGSDRRQAQATWRSYVDRRQQRPGFIISQLRRHGSLGQSGGDRRSTEVDAEGGSKLSTLLDAYQT